MIKRLCLIMVAVLPMALGPHIASAATSGPVPERAVNFDAKRSKFILSTGYRVDDVDWNIAGNTAGENPNILSELSWRDLEVYQVKIGNATTVPGIVSFRASLAYGWIFGGKNRDSDFGGNNRTQEWSRSNNDADNGNVFDASFGIGYPVTFGKGKFRLAPLLGYSYHEQNLTITDGYQVIPPLGPLSDLDSSYDTEWYGPWVGVDLAIQLNKKHSLCAAIEYHWADYYAEADWNLRTDYAHPKSFEHEADATGIVVSAGWTYFFSGPWGLNVGVDFQTWSTNHGVDRVFTAAGATATTRLNEVNWDSFAVMAGLSYQF